MNAEAALSLSPGQQLAGARKAQGKSLADIAKATKIFESRLEAIERDDYSAAGTAPAYVIGYVKAYARQVEIPEKPLVRVLESYFKQRKLTEELEQQPVAPVKPSLLRRYLPWLTTAAAVLIFLGLGQWFVQQSPAPLATDRAQSSVIPPIAERPVLSKRDENLLREEFIDAESALPASKPSVEQVEQQVQPEAQVPSTLPEDSTAVVQQVPQADADNAVVDSAAVETLQAQAKPAIEQDELVVAVTGDCWLEIYDANGERVASRLAPAGSRLTFSGVAPFNVKLGDATVASLSVNGRSVPLDIAPGRRVLRLQVGP